MRSVNTVVIPEYGPQAVLDSVKKSIIKKHKKKTAERKTALDFYYNENIDTHVEQWFSKGTLEQVPPFHARTVNRFARARNLIYKEAPVRLIGEKENPDYLEMAHKLDLKAQTFSELSWLLGDCAFRSGWDEKKKRLFYDIVPHYQVYYVDGEIHPSGVSYAIGRKESGEVIYVFWSDEFHFKFTESGKIIHINEGDLNPYGINPVTFVERHPSGSDVVRTALHVDIAMTEIALAERFGFGQPVITGLRDETEIKMGVDKVMQLGEGQDFNLIGSPGNLEQMIRTVKNMADLTAQNHHLRIRWGESSNPPSGEALKILELENLESRKPDLHVFRDWETDRYKIDRAIIDVHTGRSLSEKYRVDFAEISFPKNADQIRNDWDWKFKNKLATRQDWFRAQNPEITDEEIQKEIQRIDGENPTPFSDVLKQ